MGGERVPPVPYLLRQVRVGVMATEIVVVGLAVSYFLLDHGSFDRGGLAIVLAVAAIGGGVVALLPWRRLIASSGMRFLYLWSVADIVLISCAIAVTGGGRSELFLLYALTTFFFVASYPRAAQAALLVLTASSYAAVLALTGWDITSGSFVARVSILGVLAYLAGYLSGELLDHLEAEAAARQDADERARVMSGVASAGRDLTLDPSHVVEVVLDAATELGFADAGFVALREDGAISHLEASRGRFHEDDGEAVPTEVVALVVAQGEAVVVEVAIDGSPGTLIGCPVWVAGWLAAVLVGRVHGARSATWSRLEAFEILGTNAGFALDNAGRYEEQRATVERLEEAERLKSDFLTSVSHELRTPLTSILGNATTIERSWEELDDGTRRAMLSSLTARARELEGKITDLVDLAGSDRATAGAFGSLDLTGLLTAVGDQMSEGFEAHRLLVDVPPDLTTMGDAALLSQVVRHLLDNAATHTPPGTRVTLTAELEEASTIVVAVDDDGPGIAAADLPYVGARFFRGGDLNVRPKGLGLGLALASSALELHGSSLEVESEPGHGARFAFRLPAVGGGDARTPTESAHREGATR